MGPAQLFGGEEVEIPAEEAVRESRALFPGDMAEVDTSFGPAVRATDRSHHVACASRQVLWIPESDRSMNQRLLVCGHMLEVGHRGIDATLLRLHEYCVWRGMENDIRALS